MAENVVYGPGGWDPSKPNNNVVSSETVPDPPPLPPTADEKIAAAATVLGEAGDLTLALPSDLQDIIARAAGELGGV